VGDEEYRHIEFALQVIEQAQDLRRICACVVTSKAVVGSSAISNCGRQESAMAIMARCSMPPLN